MPKNNESILHLRGNIIRLPSHEKTEVLIFIGKNRGLDKSEVYEIIREKSRILELKFAEGRISEAPFADNY